MRNVYFGSSSSVASYYAELSEGRVQVSGDVFGWFTLSISTTTCDYNNWATAARGAATLAGIDLSAYTNIAYAFPKQQACWWSGLASLPGKHSWMNGTTSLFITSHELGHNFGVHHASSMRCTKSGSRVQYSSNCSVDEYGDPFDVMGHKGQRHMSNWRRWQLGYLSASDVLTVGGHGTYRMATAQVPGGAPRIVRVPRPSGDYYYLEYRQPYGQYDNFSPTAAVVNGVTVRIAAGVTSRSQSKLLDANPATTSWSDAAIPVGGTFVDPINGIRITTLSIDPGGATVHVQLGTDVVPPGPPTDLSAEMTVEGDVRLAWSPAPDDMGVSSYTVTRGGQLLGTVADAPFTDVAPPQGVTHDYAVQAVDAAGNSGAPATASVYVPDTTRPSVPTASTAQATGPRTVTISWTAATDNVGVVAYEVHRDSAVLATTEATTLVDEAATDGRLNSYEIRAVDAAGNRSEPAFTGIALADITAPVLTGDLVATLVSPTSVALAWPEASDNVGVAAYEVRRDGLPLTSVDTPGYVDADRAQGLAYMYEVTAVDAAGNRSATPASSIRVPDTFAPSAPADLAGALTGPHSLDLGWTAASDNVGVDRYEVTRDGQSLGSVEVPSLTGIAVVEGGTYRFTVWAIDAAGNEGVAAEVTVIVPDVTAPSGTTLSAAASGSTAASLSWAAATDNVGVAGYVVIRDGQVAATLAANAFSFVDSGLASDRRYSYAVYAFDRAGNAGPAATSSVTLTSVDVVPPSVPANLVGRSLDRRWVKLTWLASTDNRPGTLRYQVFRGTRKIATVTTLGHLDRPASVGKYKYRVRALDVSGNKSAFSAAVWVRAVRRV